MLADTFNQPYFSFSLSLVAYRNPTTGKIRLLLTHSWWLIFSTYNDRLWKNNCIWCCITGTELLSIILPSCSLLYTIVSCARAWIQHQNNTIASGLIKLLSLHICTHMYICTKYRPERMNVYYIRENKIMNLNNPLRDTGSNEGMNCLNIYICMHTV